ncbi:MAG: exodeoxyribonuclease VII large subunit [Bacteroidota bacterium]
MTDERLTLLELNQQVREGIKRHLPDNYWVISEISEIKINRRGHCYLDLIEKDELAERILAKARAIIWANNFRMLKPYFETTTGKELSAGLKILINVSVEFHELYGYSLYVWDIEPSYTLGELARQKIETIKRLEEEGIYNMNKELPFPVVPQKIAVISSQNAAGYNDFIEQLSNNPYGYIFYPKLFPAFMQGDEVKSSIIHCLEKIYDREDFFDVVAIIRGGGAQSDLSYFDQYELAANIAQFPIPVVTGIGHEKDESVVDLIAHTKLKTPTAVADFLVSKTYEFEQNLFQQRDQFIEFVNNYLHKRRQYLDQTSYKIVPLAKNTIDKARGDITLRHQRLQHAYKNLLRNRYHKLMSHSHRISNLSFSLVKQEKHEIFVKQQNLENFVRKYVKDKKKQIDNLTKAINYLDPENVLKRGFSITQKDGEVIKDKQALKKGDVITTYFYKGNIDSKVIDDENPQND